MMPHQQSAAGPPSWAVQGFQAIQRDHGTFAFQLSKGRWNWDSVAKCSEPEEGGCWLLLLAIHKCDQKPFHERAKSRSHLVRSFCSHPFLFYFSWSLNYQEKHSIVIKCSVIDRCLFKGTANIPKRMDKLTAGRSMSGWAPFQQLWELGWDLQKAPGQAGARTMCLGFYHT